MRRKRNVDEIRFGTKRPLCFLGWPPIHIQPSSFPWDSSSSLWSQLSPPVDRYAVRLDYERGWSVVIFWNRDVYFVDEILTFEGILDLIRERFNPMYLQMSVTRAYAYGEDF